MKHISIIVLVALWAVSGHIALAQVCTDELCTSTVSVNQQFTTPNCTGESTVVRAFNYTQSCIFDYGTNFNSTYSQGCSSAGFFVRYHYRTNSCPQTPSPHLVRETAVGVCVATGASSSYINWCNQASISSNFKPVKLATNATAVARLLACNVTTGCTNGTGTLTAYTSSNCAAVNATEAYPPSLFVGGALRPGICYIGSYARKRSVSGSFLDGAFLEAESTFVTASDRNAFATCRDGFYTATLSTGGCGSSANKISTITVPTDTCFPYNGGWVKITCPSDASKLVAGPLVLILLFFVLLVI